MGIGKPYETVYKITSMPRWQREWINNHRAMNYSGLVQEMLNIVIAEYDPKYFESHKSYIQKRMIRRKEVIEQIIPKAIEAVPT